jgi:hypothetical protein
VIIGLTTIFRGPAHLSLAGMLQNPERFNHGARTVGGILGRTISWTLWVMMQLRTSTIHRRSASGCIRLLVLRLHRKMCGQLTTGENDLQRIGQTTTLASESCADRGLPKPNAAGA